MLDLFEMGDTLNYKAWAIRIEIKRLKKMNKHFPDSDKFHERKERIANLERDLRDFGDED